MKKLRLINFNIWLAAVLFFVPPLMALTPFSNFTLEGIYDGTMTLTDGSKRTIPLQFSLTITDEFVDAPPDSPFSYQKVIHGSFIADDEGGPFPFANIRYDLTTGKIDFRYNRPNSSVTPTSPFNLRFIGRVQQNKTIAGRVVSGVKGQIGTFTLNRSEDKDYLQQVDKYFGVWRGNWTFLQEEERTMEVKLVLEKSLLYSSNPPLFELDHTSGRTGFIDFDTYMMAFSQVTIDYLRRQIIIFSQRPNGATVTLIADLDEQGNLTGHANSTFRGKTGVFTLTKD